LKFAVTISLVPEAARGPFVYHCRPPAGRESGVSLADACRRASQLGFDAVEIFPAHAAGVPRQELAGLLAEHGLAVAAFGTGAGWLVQGLSLSAADPEVRARAVDFVRGIIELGAEFSAPAIVGSIQGRSAAGTPRDLAVGLLAESLRALGRHAAALGQPLLYEPLNRYETDLFNRQAEAAAFFDAEGLVGLRLLCDLFHMNIEEPDPPATLAALGPLVGHVHWADSNRRALGMGHTDAEPIAAALAETGFAGYLSAEVFPLPSAEAAAEASIRSMRAHAARR
jgi:sugar phosphate isomerase/epimerase